MLAFALVALAYLCGSIPTGVLLSRRRGVDPRDIGSGNIGATNVARAAGTTAGLLTLVGDTLKALLPVLVAKSLGLPSAAVALVGVAAFLGHLYSCFLGFDGGKGVATMGGRTAGGGDDAGCGVAGCGVAAAGAAGGCATPGGGAPGGGGGGGGTAPGPDDDPMSARATHAAASRGGV